MPPETTTQPAAEKPHVSHPLVKYLIGLEASEDRASLAQLRRAASRYPHIDEHIYRHIGRFLGEVPDRNREDAMIIVASLFGLYPNKKDQLINIGDTMREVMNARRTKTATSGQIDPAIERRFLALLGSDPRDLHVHLRHAIVLAKEAGVEVGWTKLLRDVSGLLGGDEDTRNRVVSKWARSFWRWQRDEESEATSDETEDN